MRMYEWNSSNHAIKKCILMLCYLTVALDFLLLRWSIDEYLLKIKTYMLLAVLCSFARVFAQYVLSMYLINGNVFA